MSVLFQSGSCWTGRAGGTRFLLLVSFLVAPVTVAIAGSPFDRGESWPGFRGARVDGIARTRSVFPHAARFGLKVAWKRTIGSGYSSIAIDGGHVVTMYSTGRFDVVASFDEATGRPEWTYELDETYEGHDGSHTGPISTPLIVGNQVFALAPRGRLVALEVATGKLVWSVDMVDQYKASKPHYGFSTSPLLMDGVLIVPIGAKDGAIVGLDPSSGKLLWKCGEDSISYQSPIPYSVGGQEILLAAGQKKLFAVEAKDGSVLWEYEHGGNGPTGAGSMIPIPTITNHLFLANKADGSTVIRMKEADGQVTFETQWEEGTIRNSYNVPVYHEGFIYAYSTRFLTCVNAATGQATWRSRQPGDGFLILVDGQLVIITKEGSVHVVQANPKEYKESAALAVFDDLSWSPPSFANGHIYARSFGQIARIDIGGAVDVLADADTMDKSLEGLKFGHFLKEVAGASDKKEVVDRFMASVKQFPMIEGSDRIHFIYRGPGEDLAVAGDVFGARQERPMRRVEGTDLFYYSMTLEPDLRANYMFMLDYEDIADPNNSRSVSSTTFGPQMEMRFGPGGEPLQMSWFAMPAWKPPTIDIESSAALAGRLETATLESKKLEGKVELTIYLPADYSDSQEKYPVIFVHNGKEFREHAHLESTIDQLIGRGKTKPFLAVFIDSAPRSRGGPAAYAGMFGQELIPMIEGRYRISPSREMRASLGAGFGSYQAMIASLSNRAKIGRVGCHSYFMMGSMEPAFDKVLAEDGQALDIRIEWSRYDLRNPAENWDLGAGAKKAAEALRSRGHHVLARQVNMGTGWSNWKNRTPEMLAFLVSPKK